MRKVDSKTDKPFSWESEIKEEYLLGKPTGTALTNRFVLHLVDEYEVDNNKSIYNLSITERDEFIATKFKNSSVGTISKNVSIISKYIDFCINSKKIVSHNENRFATFDKNDAKRFVHKLAIRKKYVTEEQLKRIIEGDPNDRRNYPGLYNNQDKLLLWLPFIGVRGRTSEGATLEEILNLKYFPDSQEAKDNKLTLVKNNGVVRQINVDDYTMNLVIKTFSDTEYIGNNGEETSNAKARLRRNFVNHFDNYVFRSTGRLKYEKMSPELVNSRMHRIQKWIGNSYITMNSLFNSEMIQMALKIREEKDSLDKMDYVNICARFDYGETPEQYWYNVRDIVEQYLEVFK